MQKNLYGLYTVTYALTAYILNNGYYQIFSETDVLAMLRKIDISEMKGNEIRRNALISIMVHFPVVMDCFRANYPSVFEYISNCVILNPNGLNMYKVFHPRSDKTMYTFFLENDQLKQPSYTGTLYRTLNECYDFDINQFTKEMVSKIPTFNAFYDADVFMRFFIDHLEELTKDAIGEVLNIYKKNSQCTNRGRHSTDINIIKKFLKKYDTTESLE